MSMLQGISTFTSVDEPRVLANRRTVADDVAMSSSQPPKCFAPGGVIFRNLTAATVNHTGLLLLASVCPSTGAADLPAIAIAEPTTVDATTLAACDDNDTLDCCQIGPDEHVENPFILHWYYQLAYTIAFALMVAIAVGGNSVVVWIVLAHRRMRTVTNYFLVNLAVADTAMSVLNTLFNFVYMLYSDWHFGRAYCKFTQFIAPCTIGASVFTFMAIAIDRCVSTYLCL